MVLTEEQRERIARNREEALKRAAARIGREKAEMEALKNRASTSSTAPVKSKPVNFFGKQPTMHNFIKKCGKNENLEIAKPTISVKFKIYNEGRIKIEFYPFHTTIIEAIKKVGSKNYDPKTKAWTVNYSDVELVTRFLKEVEAGPEDGFVSRNVD